MTKTFTRWIVILLFILTSTLFIRKNLDSIFIFTNQAKCCILQSKVFIASNTAIVLEKTQEILHTIGRIPFLINENAHLKKKLENYEEVFNQLQKTNQENRELRRVLNFSHNTYYKFYSTKLLLVAENNYLSSAIIGSGKNIKINQFVAGPHNSVIGKVNKIINSISSIKLITDASSKISAVSKNDVKCIIAGNGHKQKLSVLYVSDEELDKLNVGDVLFASKGSIAGIPIAVITSIDNDLIYAKPAEKIKNNSIVKVIQ